MDLEHGHKLDPKLEKFGCNVSVHSLYFRHAEKASGTLGTGSQVSASLLSPRGKIQSENLGIDLRKLSVPGLHGVKIRSSAQPRTRETADEMVAGHRGGEMPQYVPRVRWEITADTQPKDFFALYVKKWEAIKTAEMKKRGIDPKDFSKLSSKEQAEIAEPAEEPIAAEWLENTESEMAQLFPLETAAAQIAVLVRRDVETANKLKNGSSIDLFSNTHRTMTEPLLMKIMILSDGSKPQKLSDIGGLLGLNDGFELRTNTDQHGRPSTKLFMYRVKNRESDQPEYEQTEYGIDLDELKRLADMGVELSRERRKKEIREKPDVWKLKEN